MYCRPALAKRRADGIGARDHQLRRRWPAAPTASSSAAPCQLCAADAGPQHRHRAGEHAAEREVEDDARLGLAAPAQRGHLQVGQRRRSCPTAARQPDATAGPGSASGAAPAPRRRSRSAPRRPAGRRPGPSRAAPRRPAGTAPSTPTTCSSASPRWPAAARPAHRTTGPATARRTGCARSASPARRCAGCRRCARDSSQANSMPTRPR